MVFFDDGGPVKCGVPRSFVEKCIKKIYSPALKRLIVVTKGRIHLFAIIPARDCGEHPLAEACHCGKGVCAVVSILVLTQSWLTIASRPRRRHWKEGLTISFPSLAIPRSLQHVAKPAILVGMLKFIRHPPDLFNLKYIDVMNTNST